MFKKEKEMENKLDLELLADFDEWRKITSLADYALSEIETKISIFSRDMDTIHKNPIEHVKRRIKKYDSVKEKLERKGYPVNMKSAVENIDDIAGLRIVCPFESDILIVRQYLEKLEREGSIKFVEIKDYIAKPKPNGYKSLHVIVKVPVKLFESTEWVTVEIQIRTVAMDFWACLEHKILYKKDIVADEELSNRLRNCAEMIALLDQEMFDINKELIKKNQAL